MKTFRIITICLILMLTVTGCSANSRQERKAVFDDLEKTASMELEYATQFSVDYYEGGYALVSIADGREYLIVPDNKDTPEVGSDVTVIKSAPDNVYVAASSAMDLFSAAGSLDRVKMTSTDISDWTLPDVRDAFENGRMIYAGKYSAPDYELLLAQDCSLAVESTMIYHSPETMEQIENLGIPVMVERSSYEEHPLGRLEWIKLYGLIMGKEEEAEKFFIEKKELFDEVTDIDIPEGERKTVAFFYISSNGYVNVRKPGDYISKMIELAGGRYIFTADDLNVDDNALSTMNMQMEAFYEKAKDADIIIYNSTIGDELENLDDLLEKSALLADFKAFQNGNVCCSDKNMFQQTSASADMILDLYRVISGSQEETVFLHRLD